MGYWIPPSACSEVMVARTPCCLHCSPFLSCHSFAFPRGGMVLGEVKRLLYLSEHMFILRPGSWGSPPPPQSSLAPCAVGFGKGWRGWVASSLLVPHSGSCCLLRASAGLAVRALVLPSFHSRLALFSFFPTFSFSSGLSCVFSQNSYGNRVFSCFLSLPLVCQISCFTNLL